MKRMLICILTAGMVIGATAKLALSHEHKHGMAMADTTTAAKDKGEPGGGEDVTLQGEILDMACFIPEQAKGAKHAECAATCVKGGAPAGLLTKNGKVYLLVPSHEDEKAFDGVKNLAGQRVSIKGDLYTRGGLNALMVESVEKAK